MQNELRHDEGGDNFTNHQHKVQKQETLSKISHNSKNLSEQKGKPRRSRSQHREASIEQKVGDEERQESVFKTLHLIFGGGDTVELNRKQLAFALGELRVIKKLNGRFEFKS